MKLDTEKVVLEERSIVMGTTPNDVDISSKFYTCVHIPSELENCNFVR